MLMSGPQVQTKKNAILIIDDESEIREVVGQILSEHYRVLFASNGQEGLELAKKEKPSAIVLDMMMPILNGIKTCEILRRTSETANIPVLMLSGDSHVDNKIGAFNTGADDYISKPFLPNELVARVRAKVNRYVNKPVEVMRAYSHDGFEIRYDEMKAYYKSKPIDLGPIEYKILCHLVTHQSQIVAREALNAFIWGDEVPSSRALDPHITSLRKALRNTNADLKTVYGRGYNLIFRQS